MWGNERKWVCVTIVELLDDLLEGFSNTTLEDLRLPAMIGQWLCRRDHVTPDTQPRCSATQFNLDDNASTTKICNSSYAGCAHWRQKAPKMSSPEDVDNKTSPAQAPSIGRLSEDVLDRICDLVSLIETKPS